MVAGARRAHRFVERRECYRVACLAPAPRAAASKPATGFDDMEDDVPF